MKEISGKEYRRFGEEAQSLLHAQDDGEIKLSSEHEGFLATHVEATQVLTTLQAETSVQINSFFEGGNIGGYYRPGSNEVQVGADHLRRNNLRSVRHILDHELGHLITGISEINLEEHLEPPLVNLLAHATGFPDLKNINIMEGFNELRTIKRVGKDNNCAYLKKEVPAAIALEDLCLEYTGKSILEAYKAGNEEEIYRRIEMLAHALLLGQTLNKIAA